ncbi:unnamed protein product, partial [Rotaria magnacalcarata]
KIGSTVKSIDDGNSSEINGSDDLMDTGLQRRRSSRVNALRFLPDNMLVLVFSYITPLDL